MTEWDAIGDWLEERRLKRCLVLPRPDAVILGNNTSEFSYFINAFWRRKHEAINATIRGYEVIGDNPGIARYLIHLADQIPAVIEADNYYPETCNPDVANMIRHLKEYFPMPPEFRQAPAPIPEPAP